MYQSSLFLSISSQGLKMYMNVLTGEGDMTGVLGKEVDKEETPHLSPLPEERKKPERQYSRVSQTLALNSMNRIYLLVSTIETEIKQRSRTHSILHRTYSLHALKLKLSSRFINLSSHIVLYK